jgi:hypothetical protein
MLALINRPSKNMSHAPFGRHETISELKAGQFNTGAKHDKSAAQLKPFSKLILKFTPVSTSISYH